VGGVSAAQRTEVLRKLLSPPQPEDEGSLDVEELTVEWASSSRTQLSIFLSEWNRRLQAIAEMGCQSGHITGKLTLVSSPSSGTEIKLVVPGGIIFGKTPK